MEKIDPYRNFVISKYLILLVLLSCSHFAQDSTKSVTSIDSTYKPFKFILSDHDHLYLNPARPDTITRKRFLWFPTKSFEDIFNYLPGYYLRYMDVGQVNQLNFNQMNQNVTAVLRNGRPINDMFDGSIDFNIFSRNEIDEIELSNGYGNIPYSYRNAVNVIQRQLFQNRPYTEISFYQDRYENLYFDGNFHQNLFSNLNFNFGITKHSYDGHYVNSDFDKWLGRFNLNFAASKKLNMFAYVNYSVIKRGLNEGINPDTVDITNKEDMFNRNRAMVNYERANERKERFDIDAGAVFQPNRNIHSRLQFYVSNSFREYYQLVNLVSPTGPLKRDVYHWINYGAKFAQILKFDISKDVKIISRTDVDYSYLTLQIHRQMMSPSDYGNYSKLYGIEDISITYRNLSAGAYIKAKSPCNAYNLIFDCIGISGGLKAGYDVHLSDEYILKIGSIVDYNFVSGSIDLVSDRYNLGLTYYENCYTVSGEQHIYTGNNPGNVRGINAKMNLRIFKFVLDINHSHNFRNDHNQIIPEDFGRADLFFSDVAFKNKLEYRIGLSSRYWQKHKAVYYSSPANTFGEYYYGHSPYNFGAKTGEIPSNATLDFFIMGKIGKATFGITLENILDRLIYNTGVYPFMDRGGLVNAISRFNITWNFFD